MENFVHDIPTKLYFGKGAISHLEEALNHFGKKVLLVYGGGSIKKTGVYDAVMDILSRGGFEVFECPGVEPNPRIESVQRGVDICKENHVDVVLAVGGGSVIDCSKAICSGFYHEGDLWDMVKAGGSKEKALPLVDILTISATGSEFDSGGVISNMTTHEKLAASFCYPYASLLDPTYTYSVSRYQTAAGSADIMSHIFEGYFSKTEDSELSDGIAETILRTVIHNLPIALKEPDNYSARANLMSASDVACSGIPEYGKVGTGWPVHMMEHELSAFYDITHGVGLAILTPRVMRFILKKDPGCAWRFVRFARNVWHLDGDDEMKLALEGIEKLEKFFKDCGIPSSLHELGIGEEHFREMAVHANPGEYLLNSFVPLSTDDIVEIYKMSL